MLFNKRLTNYKKNRITELDNVQNNDTATKVSTRYLHICTSIFH